MPPLRRLQRLILHPTGTALLTEAGGLTGETGEEAARAVILPEEGNRPPMEVPVKVKIVREGRAKELPLPEYATPFSAGVDLRAADDCVLLPGEWTAVPTGLRIELPEGYEGQVRPRSGLAARHGVTVLNAPGTIDSDYRGEIRVLLINHGKESFTISAGDRIAQLILAPVSRFSWSEEALAGSERGEGGFGSTGRS